MALKKPAAKVGQRTSLRELLGNSYRHYELLLSYGCDEKLGGLLVLLRHRSVPTTKKGLNQRTIERHRPDSYESMLKGRSLKQARAAVRSSKAALAKIKRLLLPFDNTHLKLQGSPFERLLKPVEKRVDHLSRKLDEIGPKAHPSLTGAVERIIRYVRERTGQYHDSELSELLQAAIGRPVPKGYPTFKTTEALRMWRTDHGLTDAPKRKSKILKS